MSECSRRSRLRRRRHLRSRLSRIDFFPHLFARLNNFGSVYKQGMNEKKKQTKIFFGNLLQQSILDWVMERVFENSAFCFKGFDQLNFLDYINKAVKRF